MLQSDRYLCQFEVKTLGYLAVSIDGHTQAPQFSRYVGLQIAHCRWKTCEIGLQLQRQLAASRQEKLIK